MVFDRRRGHVDRRQSHRVAAVFAVKNRVGALDQLGQAEEISPGGITLRRPRDLPVAPETPIRLSFELPGTCAEIAASGVVVRDGRAGSWRQTGVRFVELAPEDERLIEQYCRSCHAGAPATR